MICSKTPHARDKKTKPKKGNAPYCSLIFRKGNGNVFWLLITLNIAYEFLMLLT